MFSLGVCYLEMEDYVKAEEQLERAGMELMRTENVDESLAQRTFFNLGKAQYAQHKYEFAKASFERAKNFTDEYPQELIRALAKCIQVLSIQERAAPAT